MPTKSGMICTSGLGDASEPGTRRARIVGVWRAVALLEGTYLGHRETGSCVFSKIWYGESWGQMKNADGELSQHKNTRVPSEPRYELRKRNHSQKQQKSIILLIHEFEKLSINEMDAEDLSKILKESVDPKGIIFPPPSQSLY